MVITDAEQHDLDCLSALHGLTVYASQLDETGEWGVFAEDPDDHECVDIAGSGDTPKEAIAEASIQLEAWGEDIK